MNKVIEISKELDTIFENFWSEVNSATQEIGDENLQDFVEIAQKYSNDYKTIKKLFQFINAKEENSKKSFSAPVSCGCCDVTIYLEIHDGKVVVTHYDD